MKFRMFFLITLLALFSVNIFAQKQSPSEFVQSFYKFHRTRSGAFDLNEVSLLKKWFTPELHKLVQNELKREEEFIRKNPDQKPHWGDGFSFYPLEECYKKDKEIKNTLKIGKTTHKGKMTFVKVSFYYPKVCEGGLIHSYKLELVRNKSSWLINDLIYQDSGERLTEDLKRKSY